MIEDEALSRKMIAEFGDYFSNHRRDVWCKYTLIICAYPNEKYVTVEMKLTSYPQGYAYTITEDFKSAARQYYAHYYPNWKLDVTASN